MQVYLLSKREFDPQRLHKSWAQRKHLEFQGWGRGDRKITGACLPASPSQINELQVSLQFQKQGEIGEDPWDQRVPSMCSCAVLRTRTDLLV